MMSSMSKTVSTLSTIWSHPVRPSRNHFGSGNAFIWMMHSSAILLTEHLLLWIAGRDGPEYGMAGPRHPRR